MKESKSVIKHFDQQFKDSILKRLEQPTTETVTSVSAEFNIAKSTIYKWIKEKNNNQNGPSVITRTKSKWTSADKFRIVLETATLPEKELGEYCRRKGIYVAEITEWKNQCLNANDGNAGNNSLLKQAAKNDQLKIKDLEKELRRKDKALAETAALLVLKKKARAIWGDEEDE